MQWMAAYTLSNCFIGIIPFASLWDFMLTTYYFLSLLRVVTLNSLLRSEDNLLAGILIAGSYLAKKSLNMNELYVGNLEKMF